MDAQPGANAPSFSARNLHSRSPSLRALLACFVITTLVACGGGGGSSPIGVGGGAKPIVAKPADPRDARLNAMLAAVKAKAASDAAPREVDAQEKPAEQAKPDSDPAYEKSIDLGTLGGNFSLAYAVNNKREVVGVAGLPSGEEHAFLWRGGSMIDLGTLGGNNSVARGINSLGQVVGYSSTANGEQHAFLWQRGSMIDLGTLGGGYSVANGINDIGQIIGTASDPLGDTHAVLWTNGVMADLGTLGGAASFGRAIDNNGRAVGGAIDAIGRELAFSYQDGLMTGLPLFPGGTFAEATGVNATGKIVGLADGSGSNGYLHAFAYKNGAIQGLQTPGRPAGSSDEAAGVDNAGTVVGSSYLSDNTSRAIVWNNEGEGRDLSSRLNGAPSSIALAIGKTTGDIVGGSQIPTGFDFHAFLIKHKAP